MYVLLAATLPGSAIGSLMYPFWGTKGKKGTYRGTEAFSTTRQGAVEWCLRSFGGRLPPLSRHSLSWNVDSQFFVAFNYGLPLFPRCASFTYHAFGNRDATLLLFCGGKIRTKAGKFKRDPKLQLLGGILPKFVANSGYNRRNSNLAPKNTQGHGRPTFFFQGR